MSQHEMDKDAYKKLNAKEMMPETIMEAEIIEVHSPWQTPWDEENFGVNWEFRITDENYPRWVGWRMSYFTTTTPGKYFANRYTQICKALSLDPLGFDTEELEGLPVGILINTYHSKKHDEDRNGIDSVLSRS